MKGRYMKNKPWSLFHLGWFSAEWWEYLFDKEQGITWKKFWCRIKGHPCRAVHYSSGSEPNWTCKNCGDHL